MPDLRSVAALSLVPLLLLAGCSGDPAPDADPGAASASAPASAPASASAAASAASTDSGSESASTSTSASTSAPTASGTESTTDDSSPFVVAAAAVAERSTERVVTLHGLGMATLRPDAGGLPPGALAQQGRAIARDLRTLARDAGRMPPPPGSPAARLLDALGGYRALAGGLARADDGSSLGRAWFDRLGRTDRTWRAALRALGRLADRDLLGQVPALLLPESLPRR